MKVEDWQIAQYKELDTRSASKVFPTKKVVILSTPRSGSSFFCDALANTGLFGSPEEWFNPRRLKSYAKYRSKEKIEIRDYCKFIVSKTTSVNGVFSLNIHIDQYIYWKQKGCDIFDLNFDFFFYVHRKDKIAQAYSYAKALATDQWRSYFEPAVEYQASNIPNSAVTKALHMIVMWDEFYKLELSRNGGRIYCYENFNENNAFVYDALKYCGITSTEVKELKRNLSMQRTSADITRIKELKRYLDGIC